MLISFAWLPAWPEYLELNVLILRHAHALSPINNFSSALSTSVSVPLPGKIAYTFTQATWTETDNKNATDNGWQPYLVVSPTRHSEDHASSPIMAYRSSHFTPIFHFAGNTHVLPILERVRVQLCQSNDPAFTISLMTLHRLCTDGELVRIRDWGLEK
ncbi:hypothetical protein T265_00037 [Opisthorchis viverrini]|uniref:Uncharacterized protein n=1 Tax=Opisthorchis viverrini TaxID=6198 RepID=A0A075A749_OPIVI|nr:hypothetical protein T265_00037 [Opisthorchis viverrini]KER34167.1 hypothetical protein T265_00037 [Opisthorchis viverrini]